MKHHLNKARNLKLMLSPFEQLSGLRINFHKSELFCFGEAQDAAAQYAEKIKLPNTHLGTSYKSFVVEKQQNKNKKS